MLKIVLSFAAAGLLSAAAVAATPEQPLLPAPETAVTPTPATPLVPVPDSQASPSATVEPIVLYTKVKYDDLDELPRGTVPTIISIPDPCAPHCCRYIEVCVLPDCQPRVKSSPSGRKIRYDYGVYEIEITNKRDYVEVEYDD